MKTRPTKPARQNPQIDLLLEAESPDLKTNLPPVDKPAARVRAAWLHRALVAWVDSVKAMQQLHASSPVLREASKVLSAMGVAHSVCKLVEGGLVAIDIVIEVPKSGKLAIYVDGPAHYLRNSRQPNGTTLLRNRLLAAYGWRVLSVPHLDWPRQSEARVAMLQRLLPPDLLL